MLMLSFGRGYDTPFRNFVWSTEAREDVKHDKNNYNVFHRLRIMNFPPK